MKKKLIIVILVVVCAIGATVGILIAVLKKKMDVSISVVGDPVAIEIAPGQFPYSEYKLSVKRSSGKTEEVELTSDMISEEEKLKFYREGEQTVTIVYEGAKCEITVKVCRAGLDNLTFNDLTVVYTGDPIEIKVEGNVPADASVRYPHGNTFTNAGEYDVTAVVYGDAYVTSTFTAHLTIEKATYDMSGVTFSDGEFTYDGREKAIAVDGVIPKGLNVSYTIDDKNGSSATEAGEYWVTAHFTSDSANYNPVSAMTAKLKINKAVFDMSEIAFSAGSFTYDGEEHSVSLNENKLPAGVGISGYRIQKIKDADGAEYSAAEAGGNGATDAGTYKVTAHFAVSDLNNYEAIAPMSQTLVIDKAVYSLNGVHLDSASTYYDGNGHSLALTYDTGVSLPDWISYAYTIREVDDRGEYVGEESAGNSATRAGGYEVKVYFSLDNDNYRLETESLTAYLVIQANGSEGGGA